MTSPRTTQKADAALRFEWSVRALAQPAAVQLSLFPSFVCVTDELALDFDESRRRLPAGVAVLGTRGADLVAQLDEKLASMSGPAHAELWTDEALRSDPQWEQVRVLAARLCEAMGWSNDSPPSDRALYVGPDA